VHDVFEFDAHVIQQISNGLALPSDIKVVHSQNVLFLVFVHLFIFFVVILINVERKSKGKISTNIHSFYYSVGTLTKPGSTL